MSSARRKRLIGVLGGMGPAATVDFLAKVVALTQAEVDQDHAPLIVYSVPQIPPRPAAIEAGSDAPLAPMLAGIRTLEQAGAEAIVIACNTAHYWYGQLVAESRIPIIHIADAVRAELRRRGKPVRALGLMATPATITARIYQDRLDGVVGRFVTPDASAQALIDAAIVAVKRNEREAARDAAEEAARLLLARGADALLLACTELPLALAHSPLEPSCLDATAALARAAIAASFAESGVQRAAAAR
jgi:aspartate racemase